MRRCGVIATVCADVRPARPAVDCAREFAANAVSTSAVHDPQRQLMAQLDYNIMYRWFVELDMDDAVWDVAVFTKNR
jgi:transposase